MFTTRTLLYFVRRNKTYYKYYLRALHAECLLTLVQSTPWKNSLYVPSEILQIITHFLTHSEWCIGDITVKWKNESDKYHTSDAVEGCRADRERPAPGRVQWLPPHWVIDVPTRRRSHPRRRLVGAVRRPMIFQTPTCFEPLTSSLSLHQSRTALQWS